MVCTCSDHGVHMWMMQPIACKLHSAYKMCILVCQLLYQCAIHAHGIRAHNTVVINSWYDNDMLCPCSCDNDECVST